MPAQDRTQLGIAELLDVAAIIVVVLDRLDRLALEAIGDLLERPTLLVLNRALGFCSLRAGREHGRTIPLADIASFVRTPSRQRT